MKLIFVCIKNRKLSMYHILTTHFKTIVPVNTSRRLGLGKECAEGELFP